MKIEKLEYFDPTKNPLGFYRVTHFQLKLDLDLEQNFNTFLIKIRNKKIYIILFSLTLLFVKHAHSDNGRINSTKN